MKNFVKFGLRIWIAAVSIFSFLLGWLIFAHSGKPASISGQAGQAQPAQASPLEPIPTIAPLNDPGLSTQSFQTFQQQPQMQFQPRLRTGGS